VPWCDTCDRMVEDDEITDGGDCPECGRELARRRIPWHFKAMIGATAVYLAWRAYQGIGWLVHHA
jgi:DNA-directed RNA polymerase subunit RPC12/RpoP